MRAVAALGVILSMATAFGRVVRADPPSTIQVSEERVFRGPVAQPGGPLPAPSPPPVMHPDPPLPELGVLPLDLATAIEWTLANNPDLIAVRQNLGVSAEAVEVARRLPTSLNPNVSVLVQPWVFERVPGNGVQRLETLVSASLMQPVEFGHRTAHRLSIARAGYSKERWNILQAELQAIVQAYRLHQTAIYRREKLRVAEDLADFNARLLQTLRRQMEANQVSAADVVLAEVENQTTQQHVETARQEYVAALSELRQHIGVRNDARAIEPAGEVSLPAAALLPDDQSLLQAALAGRPDVHAARAQVESSRAAYCLARADRIPIPSVGPVFEHDESGVSFYGVGVSSPVPVLNSGLTLVRQREAEYRRDLVVLEQLRQKTVLQMRATLVRWNQAVQLVARTQAIRQPIVDQAGRMQRLFEAGQADVVKLFQVRQRLIEADNTQLDALWQATQAYADLMAAAGVTPLVDSLVPPANRPAVPQ